MRMGRESSGESRVGRSGGEEIRSDRLTYRQRAKLAVDLHKQVGGEIVLLGAAGLTKTEPGHKRGAVRSQNVKKEL